MKRTFTAAVVLGAALVFVSACDRGPHGEITYEVTGPAGATADVTRVLPKEEGGGAVTLAKQALPFTNKASISAGTFEVRATPSEGALTCRIVVDGKETAKKTGEPGQQVSCTAVVKER